MKYIKRTLYTEKGNINKYFMCSCIVDCCYVNVLCSLKCIIDYICFKTVLNNVLKPKIKKKTTTLYELYI